ncbi:MAG: hypothetical protein ACRC2T_11040 [Thermoguttaceae bacterium]
MKNNITQKLALLLLAVTPLSGCLALSFGGKTENNATEPLFNQRLSNTEKRIMRLEQRTGVYPPQNELIGASTHPNSYSDSVRYAGNNTQPIPLAQQ